MNSRLHTGSTVNVVGDDQGRMGRKTKERKRRGRRTAAEGKEEEGQAGDWNCEQNISSHFILGIS